MHDEAAEMSSDKIRRREFISLTGKAALLAAAFGGGGYLLSRNEYAPPQLHLLTGDADRSPRADSAYPDVVAVRSADHTRAVAAAVGLIGGIGRFISKGDIVTIKPNIGWDRTAAQGANTDPELVKAMATQCLEAGARRVLVADVPCNEARLTFVRSGISSAVKETGADLIMPEQRHFVRVDLGGEILGQWPVLRHFLETDKLINMPVVKHHNLCQATIGMKNWYGVLGGPRNRLHQKIDTSIADLSSYFRPTLIIVDATRVMVRNGPVGGRLSDVEIKDTVIASTDQVAADSYACGFLNLAPESLGYIANGAKRGLGRISGYSLVEKDVV
jgi:uncharacterized protein (DUF362 family)